MKALRITLIVLVHSLAVITTPAKAIKVERVVTDGGLNAWLVQDSTNPIITLQLAFKGSAALDPKQKLGLANLAASTIDEGAGELSSQVFQQTLEDHAIRMRFDAGIDNFGGRLQTLTRHRNKAFDLLRFLRSWRG